MCRALGLDFVCSNKCAPGGPDIGLKHPTFVHKITGDGNCLFRALSYIISGSETQHLKVRSLIVEHLKSSHAYSRLHPNYIPDTSVEQYIERTGMDRNGTWGGTVEFVVLAHLVGVNVASYNTTNNTYHLFGPGVIDYDRFPQDFSRATLYIIYNGNHFDVVLGQNWKSSYSFIWLWCYPAKVN